MKRHYANAHCLRLNVHDIKYFQAQKYALHVTKVKEENGKLVFQESAGYALDPVQKVFRILFIIPW